MKILEFLTGWFALMGFIGAVLGIALIFPGKIAEMYLLSLEFGLLEKIMASVFYFIICIFSLRLWFTIGRMEEKYSIEG